MNKQIVKTIASYIGALAKKSFHLGISLMGCEFVQYKLCLSQTQGFLILASALALAIVGNGQLLAVCPIFLEGINWLTPHFRRLSWNLFGVVFSHGSDTHPLPKCFLNVK